MRNGTSNANGQEDQEHGIDWNELFTTAKPFLMGAVAVITIGIKVIELHTLLHKVERSDEGR